MELLNEFGFDWKLFIAQIINFLIIAYLFKKFLYKPILSTLKKREETIDKGLKDAESAGKALESAELEKDAILGVASKEAERILDEARISAGEAREKILNDTRVEAEKIAIQAKEQLSLERDNFIKEAQDLSLTLSQRILEQAIKGMFDEKTQQQLIRKGLTKIKQV